MMNNWFDTARLGMFIHWGHSSQQGYELSWPLVGGVFSLPYCQDVSIEQYYSTFDQLPQPTPQQWQRYLQFLFNQVRELLTSYGKIDIFWFDGSWERTPEQWQAEELAKMIRDLQPDILINDRLPNCGDFATPEQFIPPHPPAHRWETCLTINESWGYNSDDRCFKSTRELIHTLCEVAGKGGNLLLNVSPMGNGQIPPEQIERLKDIGDWMSLHGESIVGTTPGLEPWQFYGSSTRKGDRIDLHLLMKPYETISVRGIPIKQVKSVFILADGTPLNYTTRCAIMDSLLNPNPLGELTIDVPETVINPYVTVICIDTENR